MAGWLDKLKGARQSENWPSTFASMDEFELGGPDMSHVLMNGHYTVGGHYYSAFLKKPLRSLADAEEFLKRLEEDNKVQLRYNPENPEQYEPADDNTEVNHP